MAEFLVGVFVGVACVLIGAAGAWWAFKTLENERLDLYRTLGRMEQELDQKIPEEEL